MADQNLMILSVLVNCLLAVAVCSSQLKIWKKIPSWEDNADFLNLNFLN